MLFHAVVYVFLLIGDIMRIPQILSDTIIEGAGVNTDIAEDDDEMSSPVKKGKHRNYLDYQYWYISQ